TPTTEIYTTRHTLSLHDALPISACRGRKRSGALLPATPFAGFFSAPLRVSAVYRLNSLPPIFCVSSAFLWPCQIFCLPFFCSFLFSNPLVLFVPFPIFLSPFF